MYLYHYSCTKSFAKMDHDQPLMVPDRVNLNGPHNHTEYQQNYLDLTKYLFAHKCIEV